MTQPTHKCCSYKNCRVGNDIPQPIARFQGKRGETKWCQDCREHFRMDNRLARRQERVTEFTGGHRPKPPQPAPNQRLATLGEIAQVSAVLLPDESGGLPVMAIGRSPLVKDRPDLRLNGRREINFCVR